jgi:diguanylate cyclase (GGDEF)-like protein
MSTERLRSCHSIWLDHEKKPWSPSGMPPVRLRGFLPPSRLLLSFLLLILMLGFLAPIASANPAPQDSRITAARNSHSHVAHGPAQLALPLIQQVRFNSQPIPFHSGIALGPGAGNLEIQFAAPPPAAPDHLRYQLLPLDKQWKDLGKDRKALYTRLPPGHYQFECEQSDNSTFRDPVVETLALTVLPPYWQTSWFRSLCILALLLLVFVLHKVRVYLLVRHAEQLQDAVTQTRAELTLAVKMAGDAQEALKEQALKDSLTGVWNRRALFDLLERELYRSQRDRVPVTVVMIDMDHFKSINDTYGHQTGDDVLREAAGRILSAMRPYDFVGRYGGEEFLVILPSCSHHNGVRRAEDFRLAIAERPVPTSRGPLEVTCSLGVAFYDFLVLPEEFIHRADAALYRAKAAGRNCVCAEDRPITPAKSSAKPSYPLSRPSSKRANL